MAEIYGCFTLRAGLKPYASNSQVFTFLKNRLGYGRRHNEIDYINLRWYTGKLRIASCAFYFSKPRIDRVYLVATTFQALEYLIAVLTSVISSPDYGKTLLGHEFFYQALHITVAHSYKTDNHNPLRLTLSASIINRSLSYLGAL